MNVVLYDNVDAFFSVQTQSELMSGQGGILIVEKCYLYIVKRYFWSNVQIGPNFYFCVQIYWKANLFGLLS